MGLTPLTIATARDALPASRAAPAVATLSITTVAGVGLGYPLTGLIVQLAGVHAAFWFGAAISAVALVVAYLIVPPATARTHEPLDIPGALLLAGTLGGLLLAISEGPEWGWASVPVLGDCPAVPRSRAASRPLRSATQAPGAGLRRREHQAGHAARHDQAASRRAITDQETTLRVGLTIRTDY